VHLGPDVVRTEVLNTELHVNFTYMTISVNESRLMSWIVSELLGLKIVDCICRERSAVGISPG
jgi:hypothetical protein